MNYFKEFIDRKDREDRQQLLVLKSVMEKEGLKTKNCTEESEPYVYVFNPKKDLSFDGVRIYKIGDTIAFRAQKEADTHPYGRAYLFDLEEMYSDLLSDNQMDENKAGEKVMQAAADEIKRFFKHSAEAEKELKGRELDDAKDTLGRVIIKSTGTDYSTNVTSSHQ